VAYLLAAYLLLTATYHPASLLAIPAWVLLVVVMLWRHDSRTRPTVPSTAVTPTEPTADAAGSSDPLPDAAPETTR
jgi:hypothetical protein